MRKVIFTRWIASQFYAKRAELPLAPFENLGVMVYDGFPPVAIQDVFVNRDCEVVCVLPEGLDAAKAEADGWLPVGEEPCFTSEKVPHPPKKRSVLEEAIEGTRVTRQGFPTL
jgi:hypothetical protein